jgi:hypothetical protein
MTGTNVIIIGGGVGAIAMAHTPKWKLGVSNFEVCIFRIQTEMSTD